MQHLLQEFQPRQKHQAMQAFSKPKRSFKQARKEDTAGSIERLYANLIVPFVSGNQIMKQQRPASVSARDVEVVQPHSYPRKRYSFSLELTKRLRNSSCHRLHLSTETGNIIYNSLYD